MAAYDIHKHFKGLRVETGRRNKRSDPFATGFEDDSDDEKQRRSRSKTKQASAVEKPVTSAAKLSAARDILRDSDDEFLDPPKRIDRRPSPAPTQLPVSRVTDGAGRRGSLDKGLQSKGLNSRGSVQTSRAPRSAVAQAAGTLAYLDDSDDDEPATKPIRTERFPSPAPRTRKSSDPPEAGQRSSTPKGSREAPTELGQAASQPSKNSIASPFAGTKYLEDSDSDEDAVVSRSNSTDENAVAPDPPSSPEAGKLEVKRVDKPKQNGSGISWRAFSEGRAEQRTNEIEALQVSLKQRGKSISFGSHATTDDGNRVPIPATPAQVLAGGRGRKQSRGKSPPRRDADTGPAEDELPEGGPVGIYDPSQFKTSPFTGTLLHKQFVTSHLIHCLQENPSAAPLAIQTEQRTGTEMATSNDLLNLQIPSLTSESTMSPSNDNTEQTSPISPTDGGGLENSTSSLTSKVTVSPPQTIPEGKPVDLTLSPLTSPADITSPMSRNSSTRSFRTSRSRPTRIPNSEGRRPSRRSTSQNASASPAHQFLSSWSREGGNNEPAPEPKPDDEGQAIGLNDEYIIGRKINEGGFGVVKEVHSINEAGERLVRAVKIVRKSIPGKDELENEKMQQELEHEVSIWRHLKNRHILDLHAVYDTDFATFCVMDLNIGGTLFEMVRRTRASASENGGRRGLDLKLAKHYAYQLACALRYLHEDIRVCHRDVKLENCLIDMTGANAAAEGGNLRLCDFGLADFLHSDQSVDDSVMERFGNLSSRPSATQLPTSSSVIGTLEYASPKGLSANRKLFETAGDVWAFGVVVYVLCTGELPFKHPMPSKTVELILQAEWDDAALGNGAAGGSEVRELVQGCLEKDIDLRLTIGEALQSGWFEGCREASEEEPTSVWR